MLEPLTPSALSERRRRGLALLERPPADATARVVALSTFSIDLIPPFLAGALERVGHPASKVAVGAFGQIAQELLLADSSVYREDPDVLLLVIAVEDLLEPLFNRAPSELTADAVIALVSSRVEQLRSWIAIALERLPGMTCYITLVGPATAPLEHVLSPSAPERGLGAVLRLHEEVRGLAELGRRVVVVDWDWHVRALGTMRFNDPRLWYLARMRLNPMGLATLADLFARHVRANAGTACKVAAIDLDGVLWGGVVGEGGLQGITLGDEGIGLAYQDFQRELLRLRDLGVLLALCSKNNPDDVEEVFTRHPAMILRPEHCAAERINWRDKASNLRELQHELNVGLESFVFIDDSPIEREWVRNALPEVIVPELPDDPADRPGALRLAPYFQRILSTDADRGRVGAYQTERRRRDLATATASYEEFLRQLEQQATIEPVSDATLPRAAQLCQRTNQFNLTSKRYTPAQLEAMLNQSDTELYTLSVSDRFGDSGITGFAILYISEEQAVIDTFLMSCRILGRRLEEAMLAFLAERGEVRGARSLIGHFSPTAKNAQAANLYTAHGFASEDGRTFHLDLSSHHLTAPSVTSVRTPADA